MSRRKPMPPVTKRLRRVLLVVLTLFGALTANGLYLAGVTWTEYLTGEVFQTHFYQWMFLIHLALGLVLIVPTVWFGVVHGLRSRHRRNRRAVKIGYGLLAVAIVILISGVLLMRVGRLAIVDPFSRNIVYWAHLAAPLAAVWLYWMHRLVGSRLKWHVGRRVALAIGVFVAGMVAFQASDPVRSVGNAPASGDQYFRPSLAKTATGKFIDEEVLMNDEYCLRCHADVYDSFIHSAHKLSSFNNPAYRASVRETREVSAQRDGTVQASRWCAGCHDPVVMFSGKFDDPNYDDVHDPTAHAGITCTVCHAIQSVDSHVGNADYTIDEPKHYPFTYSDHPLLQSLNSVMVKAKPAFHKSEMLKPFHKTAEFCSTCHKVSLPRDVTDYRDFLRGQNHYDSYLLSGVSGHGARSFYYPPHAQDSCNGCHMSHVASNGLGAKWDPKLGSLAIAGHAFPSANTALAHWMGDEELVRSHRDYLRDTLRIDLFGLRKDASVDGELLPLLGDEAFVRSGQSVLVETVLRTLKLGHHFTQGTTDSNQVWVEWTASRGDEVIGTSGSRDQREAVDPNAHFVNTFMLDREGNRINRRNAQDIFTPLYSHQIPPGAGQTIHYRLDVPEVRDGEANPPIEITARLLYRKFDTEYLDYVRADRDPEVDPLDLGEVGQPNDLPIVEIASDRLVLKIIPEGDDSALAEGLWAKRVDAPEDDSFPTWQRVNDYGIGLLLSGRSQWKQAAEAFAIVEEMGRFDGPLNMARVQSSEGDLDAATDSLRRAAEMDPPPPSWTHSWLSGVVNRQQGNFDAAAESLRAVLQTRLDERGFDFSKDYIVREELGLTMIDLAQRAEVMDRDDEAKQYFESARDEFLQVLELDSENSTAHSNLAQVYRALDDPDAAEHHAGLHGRYKKDDSAAELAVPKARRKYPAANRAAEPVVIYELSTT